MNNVYQIGSGELTFDIIERIINENLKLELASEARERIQKCRDYLDKKIANSDTPLYGITTGFGSLCNRNIGNKPSLEGTNDLFILKLKAKQRVNFNLKMIDGLLVDKKLNVCKF